MADLSELTVKEISERYLKGAVRPTVEEVELLRRDGRAGVRGVADALRNRQARREAEKGRIEGMLERERRLWKVGISYIAGVDEVGVGPFAGPVVAASVVFPRDIYIEGVRDSKKLDHQKRVLLDGKIRERALGVGIGLVDVEEIDLLNIYNAALKAMRLALINLKMKVQRVLVDGRKIPGLGIPQEIIHNGDEKIFSIAAASIVAKVYRDNIMIEYDSQFPEYGFAKHKGYGTAGHIMALKIHGPCPIHRRSFDWRNSRAAMV